MAGKALKRKLSSKSNGPQKSGLKKAKKTVALDNLAWKSVDVADGGLDDFEGFYGLEEVDGVSVEVENGTLKFKAAESKEDTENEEKEKAPTNGSAKNKASEKVAPYVSPFAEEEEDDYEDSDSEENQGEEEEEEGESEIDESKESKNKTAKGAENKKKSSGLVSLKTPGNPFDLLEETESEVSAELDWSLPDTTLSSSILTALSALKFYKPTDIQAQVIPEILTDSDVIGKAATGSGKTLAYGIPIIEKHIRLSESIKPAKKWPTALIFGPTRELVHQITKHLEQVWKYGNFTGSGVVAITGGLAIQKQRRLIDNNPAIIVATPGRFLEILTEATSEFRDQFKKCETLVLDEADRLIQEGHFQELEKILDLIGRGRRTRRQTLVFSATFQRDLMKKLDSKRTSSNAGRQASNAGALKILNEKLEFKDKNPVFIDSNPAESVARSVVESIMECGAMEKDLYLYYFLLTYPARSIVFVNSIDTVKRLVPFLKELGLPSLGLHSDMIQKQRLRSLERFKANDKSILVATDVAARGLDIPLIDHVVHYHLPRTADMYIHRSGRTARAGNEGVSLLLCSPDEASGPLIKLKRALYKDNATNKTAMKTFEVEYDFLNRLKPRITLAKQISDTVNQSTHKGKTDAWLKKAVEDLGVDLSDDEIENITGDRRKKNKPEQPKGDLRSLRAQLQSELQRPVGHAGKYLTRGTVNLAQMVTSGKSHQAFLGKEQTSALESLNTKPKSKK
ncbi:Mak5p [Sugiyamaella lignohabitans]|uniref:ATP-dependent RNA helicase n=1 Tax=Sugiyamaella lignohabitans TaxID=796027 RepID=A0A167F066_9ASCO|nr:Mak5p [Sugiyamaella lignohabitans]ANB14659.1 Mak5p [Sugiyamaella lignohabitans]